MNLINEIKGLLERIDENRRRGPDRTADIANIIAGERVSSLPVSVMPLRTRAIPGTVFTMAEQFDDPLKSLYSQLEDMLSSVLLHTGAPLCVRPNYGTILLPAMLGMPYRVLDDNYPWLTGHLDKKQFARASQTDFLTSDMMCKTLECIDTFRSVLPDWVHVYLPDTQGPFDIAHLIHGNDIFYALMDEPDFVHELMAFSTTLYIQATQRLKQALAEPMDSCYHGHAMAQGIWMRNGGARVSEDTPTLLSPAHIDEFVLPYDQQALAAFGGGFIHFCGKNEYLLDAFLQMEQVRVINLGNPEMYDADRVMALALGTSTTYFGPWPRLADETPHQYCARMRMLSDGASRGLLLLLHKNMFQDMDLRELLNMLEA